MAGLRDEYMQLAETILGNRVKVIRNEVQGTHGVLVFETRVSTRPENGCLTTEVVKNQVKLGCGCLAKKPEEAVAECGFCRSFCCEKHYTGPCAGSCGINALCRRCAHEYPVGSGRFYCVDCLRVEQLRGAALGIFLRFRRNDNGNREK